MSRRLLLPILLSASSSLWAVRSSAAPGVTAESAAVTSQASFTGTSIAGKAAIGQDTGVKLSDDSVLHVGVGAEAGYDTNVFYSDTAPVSAPLMRVTPFAEITNATRGGAAPSNLFYDLATSLQYREYLGGGEEAKQQRAFNPTISGNAEMGAGQRYGFLLADQFVRTEEPPYGTSRANITRNNNVASAQVRAAPGGGRLQALLRYTNGIDVFDNADLKYANLMGNELLFDGSWRWLPKTAIFVQAAQGAISYFNKDSDPLNHKENSFPFRVMGGLRGLVTEKLSVNLAVGYAAGFYQGVATNPTGISNLAALGEINYKITQLTEFVVGYRHEFRNSVIGTFYDLDSPYVGLRQKVGSQLSILAHARYEFRRYHGFQLAGNGASRSDQFLQAGLQVDYQVQKWFYAGVGYLLMKNTTDFQTTGVTSMGGFNYVKQQVFARLGVTY